MTAAEFAKLVCPCTVALYRLALHLTRSPSDAEDLVQSTFLRAFERRSDLREPAKCGGWLRQILMRLALKARARRRMTLVPIEDVEGGRMPSGNLEEEILSQYLFDRVQAALAGLPDPFRNALLLVDVDGLTYQEAAKVLDCPVGTVRSRLSRARISVAASVEQPGICRTFAKAEPR